MTDNTDNNSNNYSKEQLLEKIKKAYRDSGRTEKEISMYELGFEQGISFYAGLIEGCLMAANDVAKPIDFNDPAAVATYTGSDSYECPHVEV